MNKKQTTSIISITIIGLIEYFLYLFGGSMENFEHGVTATILNMGIFGVFLYGFRVPPEKSSKVFSFWFTAFPLVFILILIGYVYGIEQIEGMEPIDPFFKISLGIAVLPAMGALMVMINAEKRISNLEKEILAIKEKMNMN